MLVGVLHRLQSPDDLRLDADLLAELAQDAGLRGFSGVDLAARDLPPAGVHRPRAAAADQDLLGSFFPLWTGTIPKDDSKPHLNKGAGVRRSGGVICKS